MRRHSRRNTAKPPNPLESLKKRLAAKHKVSLDSVRYSETRERRADGSSEIKVVWEVCEEGTWRQLAWTEIMYE